MWTTQFFTHCVVLCIASQVVSQLVDTVPQLLDTENRQNRYGPKYISAKPKSNGVEGKKGLSSSDQVVIQDATVEYPKGLTYTEQHMWFAPDKNESNTRIGITTWPITQNLHNDIDGAVLYPDRNDTLKQNQSIGRLFGPQDDEIVVITVPYDSVYYGGNLDLDLNVLAEEPYGDDGFIAVLLGTPPTEPPKGAKFMDYREYEEYVRGLK